MHRSTRARVPVPNRCTALSGSHGRRCIQCFLMQIICIRKTCRRASCSANDIGNYLGWEDNPDSRRGAVSGYCASSAACVQPIRQWRSGPELRDALAYTARLVSRPACSTVHSASSKTYSVTTPFAATGRDHRACGQWRRCAGIDADRRRQVALLSGSGALARGAGGGGFTAHRADGRSGRHAR